MSTQSFDEYLQLRHEWSRKHPVLSWLKYELYYPLRRLLLNQLNVRNWCREVKWFCQRGYRGWADCDVWSIDYYLNRIMPEMLEHLAKHKCGHPAGLSEKRWNNMLLKQAANYRQLAKCLDEGPYKDINKIWLRINKFMKKYYFHLWD